MAWITNVTVFTFSIKSTNIRLFNSTFWMTLHSYTIRMTKSDTFKEMYRCQDNKSKIKMDLLVQYCHKGNSWKCNVSLSSSSDRITKLQTWFKPCVLCCRSESVTWAVSQWILLIRNKMITWVIFLFNQHWNIWAQGEFVTCWEGYFQSRIQILFNMFAFSNLCRTGQQKPVSLDPTWVSHKIKDLPSDLKGQQSSSAEQM